jgi:hypothetical protein
MLRRKAESQMSCRTKGPLADRIHGVGDIRFDAEE